MAKINYNEGDLVICKVIEIVKTTVLVETLDGTKGSIVLSEIAPGRIRNLRVYVVPNKMIVCKILSVKDNHLFLSLRRVKEKERKDMLSEYKKEKMFESIIKKTLGQKSESVIKKIKETQSLNEFIEEARQNQSIIEKYFTKDEIKSIEKILEEKKEKERELKKEFKLSCKSPDGIIKIKYILKNYGEILYLGGSKFVIKKKSHDLKKTDNELKIIIEAIEKEAKKQKCDFLMLKG